MWGPVNPVSDMIDGFDAGIIDQKRGKIWGEWSNSGPGPYQTFTADLYRMTGETDDVEVRHYLVQDDIPTPLQLRTLISQYCNSPTGQYNSWNTLTYHVRTFSQGVLADIGPEYFPPQ